MADLIVILSMLLLFMIGCRVMALLDRFLPPRRKKRNRKTKETNRKALTAG